MGTSETAARLIRAQEHAAAAAGNLVLLVSARRGLTLARLGDIRAALSAAINEIDAIGEKP